MSSKRGGWRWGPAGRCMQPMPTTRNRRASAACAASSVGKRDWKCKKSDILGAEMAKVRKMMLTRCSKQRKVRRRRMQRMRRFLIQGKDLLCPRTVMITRYSCRVAEKRGVDLGQRQPTNWRETCSLSTEEKEEGTPSTRTTRTSIWMHSCLCLHLHGIRPLAVLRQSALAPPRAIPRHHQLPACRRQLPAGSLAGSPSWRLQGLVGAAGLKMECGGNAPQIRQGKAL